MGLVRCDACGVLIFEREEACPFCGDARATHGLGRHARRAVAVAAGIAAGTTVMIANVGCAYGCYGGCGPDKDTGVYNKPDVTVGDAPNDTGAVDATMDVQDAPVETGVMDAGDSGG